MRWLGSAAHARWLEAEIDRVFGFGRAAMIRNGFGWLDDTGRVKPDVPTQLWVTARMTHVYSLAALMGRPGAGLLADHGVTALTGPFADAQHGGWFTSIDDSGPVDDRKAGYPHYFVVLAAASATTAGRNGAEALLRQALELTEQRFWRESEGGTLESWDRAFTETEAYRGGNVNMHAVEAYLAAADVTGEQVWIEKALRISERMIHHFARGNSYRVFEHFDIDWRPLPDYNIDDPAHRFRAFGSTPGHWMEWARLLLHLGAGMASRGMAAPEWLVQDARALFAAAVRDAWRVDGSDGFVYSVDWNGKPVVRQRIRWVLLEGIGAAAALFAQTGDPQYEAWYERLWDYAHAHLIDYENGSWWQELNPDNTPADAVWDGKPDLYHLMHALLIPRLPLSPALAPALAAGLLDSGGARPHR